MLAAAVRAGGGSFLHPRAGAGEPGHRGSGGLGPLVALAGLPALRLDAGLRGRHHLATVGRFCRSLLQKVGWIRIDRQV